MPPPKGQAYYTDGTPIPEADLPKAIADGTARWRKGDVVHFAAPDGSGWDIPAERAAEQLAKGWRPVTANEQAIELARREAPSMAQVLGGVALGLGEALPGGRLVTDRFVSEQERAEIEARTPIAKAVGEGIGFGAPMLAGGPLTRAASVVAGPAVALSAGAGRIGAAVGARVPTALAGVTEFGVASGIEAAAYSAGNELARQARGNEGFNAEAFASAVGKDALFGVVAGTGIVGARGLVRGVAKRGADSYRGLMQGLSGADDVAARAGKRLSESEAWRLKAMGVTPGQHKNIAIEDLKLAAQEIKNLGIIKNEGAWAASVDDLVTKADRFKKAHAEINEVHIPGVYSEADKLMGKMPSLHPKARAIDAIASPAMLARKADVVAVLTKRAGELTDKGGTFADAGRKLADDWLEPLQKARTLDDLHQIDIQVRRKADKATDPIYGDQLALFRGELKTQIRKLIDEVSPELGTKLRKLDATSAAFSKVAQPIEGAAKASQAKTVTGLTAYEATLGAGGLAFGTPGIGAVLAGTHAAVRHLKGSDRFAAFMAHATDSAADVATKKRFTISGAIKAAAERSPIKISAGTPGRLVALTKDYHEKTSAAKEAVINPQPTLFRLANNLAPLARVNPDQARRLAELYSNDLAWLAAQIPRGWSVEEDLNFLLKSAEERALPVSPSAANKFVRTSNVLADPMKEVAKVASKKELPAPETVTVLAERRPETRKQVEKEFDQQMLKLAEKGRKMSYEARIQASILTGKPYDSTMTPEAINFYQVRWSSQWAPAEPAPAPSGGARRGRVTKDTRKRVSRFQTTAESNMDESDL